jgi:hypothetical protein
MFRSVWHDDSAVPHPSQFDFPDADVLVEGTKFLQKWVQTAPVSDLVAALHAPNTTLADNGAVQR